MRARRLNVIHELINRSRAGLASARIVPALAAGSSAGLSMLVAQIAYATLVFSGPLAPYSSQGIGLVLFGSSAGCLVVALAGGYRGAISALTSAMVIVMAQIGATIEAKGDALFATTVVAFAIGAAGTGAFCILIGRFRLANLVRFIPYPVASGFVAGIGGAVCAAAIKIAGAELDWRTIPTLFEPVTLWRWAPGVLYGFGLYVAMRRWSHPLIVLVSVVLSVGGYQVAIAVMGMSGEEAREAGYLLANTVEGGLWPAIGLADLALIDWPAISGQIPDLLVLALVALISIVMGLAGLEVALNEDLDWDREFQAAGAASVIGGLGGGTFICMIVPASYRSRSLGASTRLTGVVCALVLGSALFFGGDALEFIPVSLVGGFMFCVGLSMIAQGLLRSRKRLPWSEYGIVLLIFVATIALGLIEGVTTGILAALVFFTVRLSRTDPIASRFTGRVQRSNKVRPPPDRAILLEHGEKIHGYRLGGYLFFGSAWPLAAQLKQSLKGPVRPTCLILDLEGVSGFDFSAVSILGRFFETARASGVRVVLSASSETLRAGLKRNLPAAAFLELAAEANEDRALERCEDFVIEAWNSATVTADKRRDLLLERTAADLERYLERQAVFEELVEQLTPWLVSRSYQAGEALIGTDRTELELLVEGRTTAYDVAGARLHQCTAGHVVWPLSAVDARAASMVADVASQSAVLEPEAWRWLEEHETQLALKLYRYMFASSLAAKPPAAE